MRRIISFKMLAIVLTCIFSSLLLTGCHNDNELEVASGRDELSNTSWKLESISGWGASSTSDWRGEILVFGSDGTVTEKYVEGGSDSGSYTLSDGKIRFDGINAWTNTWGSRFTYSVSGETLILKDDMGSMSSTFHFTKL